jgi:glutamyl-Q tRNA(Asp) synthetase
MAMPLKPILRFAPSPNGYLHLGHAYSALMTWGAAEALGGEALLRIEDIDRARSKPEFTQAIFEDLRWLGLRWAEPVMRQSDRFAVYRQAFEKLRQSGLAYPCFCSRAEVRAAAKGADPDGAPLYAGTCRTLPAAEVARRLAAGERPQWRLAMAAAKSAAGPLIVHELLSFRSEGGRVVLGEATARPAAPSKWGDAVIVRKDTPTSYHLSVVIDDAAQGVTHVTRGMDLEPATDLQVLVQALLGLPHPIYAHHALILDAEDRKLSKSRGSPSLMSLREAGRTPAEVRGMVGFR